MASAQGQMHQGAVYTYLTAMRDEVATALWSHLRIQEARRQLRARNDGEEAEHDDVRHEDVIAEDDLRTAIQSLLTAQARLSLFLFPQSSQVRAQFRATELRRRLDIDEQHPIRRRDLRNSWMHLDEAIDAYIWETDPSNLILSHYGDAHAVMTAGDARRVVCLIDPSASTISLFGREHDVESLYAEVRDVGLRLDRAIALIEASPTEIGPPEAAPP